eukprot:TRINITY_DN21932_c1_g2_i1.p2 TRINITY_DN21932_c1_g2~~TRINITY_DN21932_c1_g2_i1.p2  ORF type:complete len:168 (+),score=21.01 TRINITY_DN21932_c1_g2_i1:431-934(+)
MLQLLGLRFRWFQLHNWRRDLLHDDDWRVLLSLQCLLRRDGWRWRWWRWRRFNFRRRIFDDLIEVVDPEADFAPHPAEDALPLERVVDDARFVPLGELAARDGDAAEEVVLAGGAEALVVVDLELELLGFHGVRVEDVELQRLVPLGIQISNLGLGSLLLPVEVDND